MATLAEAQASVTSARQQLTAARQTLSEQEKQVEAVRFPQRSLRFQQEVIKPRRREYAGRIKAKKGKLKREKVEAKQKIGLERTKLSEFERKEIAPVERQIKKVREEQEAAKRIRSLIDKGRWHVLGYLKYKGTPFERRIIRNYFAQRKAQREYQQKLLSDPELLQSEVDLLTSRGLSEDVALRRLGFTKVETEITSPEVKSVKVNLKPFQLPSSIIFKPTPSKGFEILSTAKIVEPEFQGFSYIPSTNTTKPQELSIGPYVAPTAAEIKESEVLKKMGSGGFKSEILSNIGSSFMEISERATKKAQGLVGPTSTYEFVESPTGVQSTAKYQPIPFSSLSQEQQLQIGTQNEELLESLKVETKLKSYQQQLQSQFAPGGVTESEAALGTELLNIRATELGKQYVKESKERQKTREQNILYGNQITWLPSGEKFDPYKMERGFYENKIFTILPDWAERGIAKTTTGLTSLGVGAYEGIRLKPREFLKTTAIAAGVTAATWGVGTLPSAAGYAAAGSRLATGIKTVGYGVGAVYGGSVAYRIGSVPTLYGKTFEAGKITGQELIPMAVGFRGTRYVIRRGSLGLEKVKVIRGKSDILPKGFEFSKTELAKLQKEYRLAKALGKRQPTIREISFEGMKRIPLAAQKPIMKFIQKGKRQLIVGGSLGGQKTQALTPLRRQPGDIDIFVRGPFAGIRGKWYGQRLGRSLMAEGIKVKVTKTGAIKLGGEKMIEFHPYKTFLRSNIEQVLPWYRFAGSGIGKTPSGIRVLRIGPQAQQKVLGYLRYGPPRTKDILDWQKTIRPTLLKEVEMSLPKGIEESLVVPGSVRAGQTALGATVGGPLVSRTRVIIKTGLPEPVRTRIIEHELVHAARPFWSERAVGRATIMSSAVGGNIQIKNFVGSLQRSITGWQGGYKPFKPSQTGFFYPVTRYAPSITTVPYTKPYQPIRTTSTLIPTIQSKPYQPTKTPGIMAPTFPSKPYTPTPTIPPMRFIPFDSYTPTTYEKQRGGLLAIRPRISQTRKKKKKVDIFQKTGYTPSLTGIQFRFKSKAKPGKVFGGYFAGIRPVVTTSRRRLPRLL